MPEKNTTWYIKTSILSVLLFVFTLLFGNLVSNYISIGDYFSFQGNGTGWLVLTMTVILILHSLTVGSWDKWEQYVVVPLPISIGVFFYLVGLNFYNALTAFIVVYGILCFGMYRTVRLKNLLTKFEPRYALRISSKGLILSYSLFAVLILMLGSTYTNVNDLNIGNKIATVVSEPLSSIYNMSFLEGGIENIVENQINSVIEPYRNLFRPLMAIFMFFLFKFFGSMAYILYSISVGVVFRFARKTGFIKYEKIMIEKETPVF